MDLSVLIPARNEEFLTRTIEDILEHMEGDTEIIAMLDGAWADPPVKDHPAVTLVYHPVSVGQRAATNEAARLARGRYVMKCDAHCAFDQGFDVKMMADMQDDWTMVPAMRNLHAFDWVCRECGHRKYQGPTPDACPECNGEMDRDIVWIAKTNPKSTSYCFDSEPHFQYFREFKKRPEGKGDLTETMSLQGSCWMLTRDRYWELGVCDEKFGSWGSQGIEVAVKSWLSGGRVIVNHKTWYAHLFRTQGGDFGFPYPLSGKQTRRAKAYAKELFFMNKWPGQVRPLSWLIEKFWPVKGWTEEDLARVAKAGAVFSAANPLASSANSLDIPILATEKASLTHGVPPLTGVLSGPGHVAQVRGQSKVGGIATPSVLTEVFNLTGSVSDGTNEPGIHEAVNANTPSVTSAHALAGIIEEPPISSIGQRSGPIPAISDSVKLDIGEEPANGIGVQASDDHGVCHGPIIQQITENVKSKEVIYYTDNRLDPQIMEAAQRQLERSGLSIISVSLKPLYFGDNFVLDAERGALTMFKQILAGLETSTADIVFFAEHDVLYHTSHFEFVPEHHDVFYYNQNSWKVDSVSGQALFHYASSTSGLCAYRELLLEHYRKRVAMVEQGGYTGRMGYEPGTHGRAERVDDYKSATWMSPQPNIDIRHRHNLTKTRWYQSEFRNKRYTKGWTEAGEVPGWGRTRGRMKEVFDGLSN